jgi:peptidoglycan/LPS O-acetylase OafA/YrhL
MIVAPSSAVERTPDSASIPTAPHSSAYQPHLSDAHFPALDGIRGIAILWVMLFHMNVMVPLCAIDRIWAGVCGEGGIGVEIFFVLSGFLITGILFDTRKDRGYFRNFYARRILRIFPLYYAVVAFCLLVLPHIPNPRSAKFGSVQGDAIFYWLHLSNFAIARRGKFVHGILDVSWSLSIEEQFYLLWPLAVSLLRRHVLMGLCCVLTCISIASRLILWRHGAPPVALYTLTFCRMDGLSIGAWLALFVRFGGGRRFGILPLFVAAGAVVVWAVWTMRDIQWLIIAMSYPAIALATAAVILTVVRGHAKPLNTLLSLPPLRFLDRLSYALYLFHYPLMSILRGEVFSPQQLPRLLGSAIPGQLAFDSLGITISCGAAWLSWHCFEKRFLKLKRLFPKAGQR